MTRTRLAIFLALIFGLSACDATYVSSRVTDRADGLDVRVVPISAETTLQANRQAYAPRSLPDVFLAGAGGGSPRGTGALPPAPRFPDLTPGRLELRAPPATEPGAYRLGPGDTLRLAQSSGQEVDPITGTTDGLTAQQELIVRDDGAVSIPRVGAVEVQGLTIDEAEGRIFERMIDVGIDPAFGLQISGFNSKLVSVGGSVANEQVISLGLNRTSLAQALAQAGGITVRDPEYASVRLYRDATLYQIPLETFHDRADLQRLAVLPGDAIFVDTGYDLDRAQEYYRNQIDIISLRRADRTAALNELGTEIGLRRAALEEQRGIFLQRNTLGAVKRDYIYLAGEVSSQTRWPLPFDEQASLADVLYDNGGYNTVTGNPAQIYVLRAATDPAAFGAVTAWHLDARNAVALTLAPKFQMRPDDIVFIEQQPITTWNRAVQQALPSLFSTMGAVRG